MPPVRDGQAVARHPASIELAALTAAKVVNNAALRWVGPFLPTLARAFGASTGTLTGVMGVAELGGLSTVATGGTLDRGHERRVFVLGTAAVAVSSLIALGGNVTTFAIAYLVLVLGNANFVVAGHAWIGHRVPFSARSRAIGLFETSWALALLIGAPILALTIRAFGWRGAYLALAIGAAAAVVTIRAVLVDGSSGRHPLGRDRRPTGRPLPRSAWRPMLASAATAAAGLGGFVISGTWLDDAHGISTAGLGLVAAMLGAVELMSSSAVALFADRVGTRRSVALGLLVLGAGIGLMATSGDSRSAAIAGLVVFLGGFEFAFVASLSLVTEAAPDARGRAIGASNAIGTVARATAVVLSGQLYEAWGIGGSLALVGTAAAAALGLTVGRRGRGPGTPTAGRRDRRAPRAP